MNPALRPDVVTPPSRQARAFEKSRVYEGSGALSALEEDIGRIRGLDQRAHRFKWAPWVVPLPLPAAIALAMLLRSDYASPAALVLGVVLFIAGWVMVWRVRRFDVENRRYELANGLLRTLALHPLAPVHLRMDLTTEDAYGKIVHRANDWTYYRDPWLAIDATLADNVQLALRRIAYLDSLHQITKGVGNRTVNVTEKRWYFEDDVTLLYDAARFPSVAQHGPGIHAWLRLPPGLEGKLLENTPGRLRVVVRGNFRWDAGPNGGAARGHGDAVALAGMLISALHGLLGSGTTALDLARARALPPPAAIAPPRWTPPSWLTLDDARFFGPAAVLAVGAFACVLGAYFAAHDAARDDSFADQTERLLTEQKECRRRSNNCRSESELRAKLEHERDEAHLERIYAAALGLGGGLLGLASAGGFVFWQWRRTRRTPASVMGGAPGVMRLTPGR